MFLKLKTLTKMSALRQAMSLTTVFLVILILIWFSVLWITKGRLEVNLDASLQEMISEFEDPNFESRDDRRHGKLYWSSKNKGEEKNIPNEFANKNGRFHFDTRHGRFEGLSVKKEEEVYVVALSRRAVEDPLKALNKAFLFSALMAIAAAIGFGLFFGLKSQTRLNKINRTLDQLSTGQLDARTGLTRSKDDIDHLAHNLDQTADHMQKLVEQTRNLGANIAHDLRTPLARLRAIIEVQDNEPALLELDRISGTFDAIMRIARVEAGKNDGSLMPIDLGELTREIYEMFAPVVEDQGRILTLENTNSKTIMADLGLLNQALANLISNALIYGLGEIKIGTNGFTIFVSDEGNGVPEAEFDKIQKPMVRLDNTRQSEGAGLGLALVRAIADRHQSKIIMRNIEPKGFEVSINFATF